MALHVVNKKNDKIITRYNNESFITENNEKLTDFFIRPMYIKSSYAAETIHNWQYFDDEISQSSQ